jgi:hypothetical protein
MMKNDGKSSTKNNSGLGNLKSLILQFNTKKSNKFFLSMSSKDLLCGNQILNFYGLDTWSATQHV